MQRAPKTVFVFSGSADGKTLFMDRVSRPGKPFVDLVDSGLKSYDFPPQIQEAGRSGGRGIYINGKRYCL